MKTPFEINLKDKVCVVTGGGGVLCGAFSKALAANGAKVAVLDLRIENANAPAPPWPTAWLMKSRPQAVLQ